MDQNETLGAGGDETPDNDSGDSSASKRLKTPSAKVADQDTPEKLPQMVINNDLLTFIAKCILADPDKWGVLLTTKHGKTGVANKFVKFLSEHSNPLTHGKTASATTVSSWIKRGKDRADEETVRRATGNASGRGLLLDQRQKWTRPGLN